MDRYQSTLEKLRHMLEGWSRDNGGRLPAERELADQLGVGRRVLRRALGALEADGLLPRRQGSGTFVAVRPQPSAANHSKAADDADPSRLLILHPNGHWLT